MVDARKYFGGNFITLEDVAEGPMRIKIVEVREGKFGKLEIISEEGFVFSLNATNTRKLVKAYGGNTDGWIDQEIELFAGEVEYMGKLQPSILINPISVAEPKSPVSPAPPTKPTSRNSMDDDITF